MSRLLSFAPRLALLAALSLLGFSCNSPTIRIMPLGDSITAGLTVINGVHTLNGGYRRHLETLLDAEHVDFDFVGSQIDSNSIPTLRKHHEGHSGWRIQDIDAHVAQWVGSTQPNVILLLIGANDIYQQLDLPHAPARFAALLDHLQRIDPGVWIFASSILPMHGMDAEVQAYNSAIGDEVIARQNLGQRIRWVDVNHDSGLTSSYQDLPDGLHPNIPGYDKIANVWFAALKDFAESTLGVPQ